MKKAKILQVAKFYYPVPGGMETFVRDLCNQIKEKFNLKVIVANTSLKTIEQTIDGVQVRRLASFGEVASTSTCFSMPYWIWKEQADIIHIHLPNPIAVISYLLVKPKGRLIVHYHSDIFRQKLLLKFYRPFLISFLKKADVIIATSENYINSSIVLNHFKNKCKPIPLGIKPDAFISTFEIEKRIEEVKSLHTSPIILFVGRLVYYKGIEYLIQSMPDIQAQLIIIGSGPLESNLKSLVSELKLEKKVKFLGEVNQNELIAYYYACDIFCLPSIARSEAFGIVQLEAMICGKPVVSTKLETGVSFVNQHRKTGILVPPKNNTALTNAINELLTDEQLRISLGSYAKDRVLNHFDQKMLVEDIIKIYSNQEMNEEF